MVLFKDFPLLDFEQLSGNFDNLAQHVFAASCEWGFLVLSNHGIEGVDEMFQLSEEFFDLPKDYKRTKLVSKDNVGYDNWKANTFAASEGISFGLPAGELLTTDDLHDFFDQPRRAQLERFKAQCYDLSMLLMCCFAKCMNLPGDHFQTIHQQKFPGDTLKWIKYPKLDTQPDARIPRLSEHTDWGSLTFVFAKTGGLEVQTPEGNCTEVPVLPNSIVINIADALSLWTNKKLKSTMHRISWDNLPRDQDRYSIAYFTNPNADAELFPKQRSEGDDESTYPAITFGEYWRTRFRLTHGVDPGESAGEEQGESHERLLKVIQDLQVANGGIKMEEHQLVTATV